MRNPSKCLICVLFKALVVVCCIGYVEMARTITVPFGTRRANLPTGDRAEIDEGARVKERGPEGVGRAKVGSDESSSNTSSGSPRRQTGRPSQIVGRSTGPLVVGGNDEEEDPSFKVESVPSTGTFTVEESEKARKASSTEM